MRKYRLIAILTVGFLLFGCSKTQKVPFMYRADIQQGNNISQQAVNELKMGMPEDQVRYIMGNPVLINSFDKNKLIYIYTFAPAKGKHKKRTIFLTFKDGHLSKMRGDLKPVERVKA